MLAGAVLQGDITRQVGQVQLGAVVLDGLECRRTDPRVDQDGYDQILGNQHVGRGHRSVVQVPLTVISPVRGKQPVDAG